MAHGDESRDARDPGGSPPRYSLDVQSALVSDGFSDPTLAADDAPPPYGELHDQLQFSQPGFEAGANVTGAYLPPIHFEFLAPRSAEGSRMRR